jgi:hypothetical protein
VKTRKKYQSPGVAEIAGELIRITCIENVKYACSVGMLALGLALLTSYMKMNLLEAFVSFS